MKHEIPVEAAGPNGQAMADAISSCVHCGFCLPTCPTYVEMGEEMDSPRGRIFLMKEALEGGLELEAVLPYIDNCLGCQACVTSCPSGVPYGDLITPFREYAEERRERPVPERAQRALVLKTVAHPRRFRAAMRAGALARPVARFLPDSLSSLMRMVPRRLPPPGPALPAVHPAQGGAPRARVALLAGCAQQVLAPDINWATLRVLARNGIETVIPSGQGCCGALAMHTGAADEARRLARHNLAAFGDSVDAVITNAAGCGSGMEEYGMLFRGTDEERAAEQLAGRVVDVSTFLDSIGLTAPAPALAAPTLVAYQDACHLAHAQKVRSAPRALLESIGNVTLVEPDEWELCCGSAGTYNLEKPEVADRLGARKARSLAATGARIVTTGNIGCLTQLQTHLAKIGHDAEIMHTIQLLDRAYARGG